LAGRLETVDDLAKVQWPDADWFDYAGFPGL